MKRLILLFLCFVCCSCPSQAVAPLGVDATVTPTTTTTPTYVRDEWGRWIDADKDCQDTRQEVLIAESIEPVTFEDERQCRVKTGKWICPYTGQVFTSPRDLEIDHMVPLAEAHASGGWAWDSAKKLAFFNNLSDPDALVAASVSSNRSKGARQPHEWLPANENFRCRYLQAWARVKVAWGLEVDPAESQAFVRLIGTHCR